MNKTEAVTRRKWRIECLLYFLTTTFFISHNLLIYSESPVFSKAIDWAKESALKNGPLVGEFKDKKLEIDMSRPKYLD